MNCRTLLVDLILLDMSEFDVILGMDWLLAHHSSIDCFRKTTMFTPVDQPLFVFQSIEESRGLTIISAIKARKLLNKGCSEYLGSLVG